MKKGIIITFVILLVLLIVFFSYRYYRRRRADKLEIKLGNINWDSRNVEYTILQNGKFRQGGTAFYRKDLIGLSDNAKSGDAKNEFFERMEQDAMVLYGKSAGIPQYRTTIDFIKKTVS